MPIQAGVPPPATTAITREELDALIAERDALYASGKPILNAA